MLTTKQEIFDKVAVHLLTQNAKSTKYGGACAYRGEDGLMCAVGCLIDGKHYTFDIENKGVVAKDVLKVLKHTVNVSQRHTIDFLQNLQTIHDNYDPEEWRVQLIELAKAHNLSTEVVLMKLAN